MKLTAAISQSGRASASLAVGFTLIELLLVLSLIVTLIAGFGAALRDDSGRALSNAQHLLAALVKQARDEAIARQSEIRMVVRTDQAASHFEPENYHCLQLWQADRVEPGRWHPLGRSLHLPPAVRLLPADSPGDALGGSLLSHPEIPASTLARGAGHEFPPAPGCRAATTVLFLEFQPHGSFHPNDDSEARLILGSARDVRGQEPKVSVGRMRGVVLRTSGAISFLEPSDR